MSEHIVLKYVPEKTREHHKNVVAKVRESGYIWRSILPDFYDKMLRDIEKYLEGYYDRE